jgi:single-strand DNA-binding protein
MADLNQVSLIGRLTRDPVTKTIPSGNTVTTFGLATSRKYKDQAGGLKEETTFVDITCWGKLGEIVCRYVKKGRLIYVGGRLKYESWDDKQTGQKRSKLTVTAEDVQFLDSRRDETIPTHVEGFPVDSPAPTERQPGEESEAPTPDHWPGPTDGDMPPF